MSIVNDLISSLDTTATPKDIRVGAFWTSVVMERGGNLQAGLSSTYDGGGFTAGMERVRVSGVEGVPGEVGDYRRIPLAYGPAITMGVVSGRFFGRPRLGIRRGFGRGMGRRRGRGRRF